MCHYYFFFPQKIKITLYPVTLNKRKKNGLGKSDCRRSYHVNQDLIESEIKVALVSMHVYKYTCTISSWRKVQIKRALFWGLVLRCAWPAWECVPSPSRYRFTWRLAYASIYVYIDLYIRLHTYTHSCWACTSLRLRRFAITYMCTLSWIAFLLTAISLHSWWFDGKFSWNTPFVSRDIHVLRVVW